jgi:hypothetical protein
MPVRAVRIKLRGALEIRAGGALIAQRSLALAASAKRLCIVVLRRDVTREVGRSGAPTPQLYEALGAVEAGCGVVRIETQGLLVVLQGEREEAELGEVRATVGVRGVVGRALLDQTTEVLGGVRVATQHPLRLCAEKAGLMEIGSEL